jgi:CBS-domain-containing membrane protein
LDFRRLPRRERWISGVGGAVAIALVLLASRAVVGEGAGWIVASMGASAVLLFAVPHGPLSQPWQVIAGHVVPAIIGVACARWIANPVIAAGTRRVFEMEDSEPVSTHAATTSVRET